MPRGDTGTEGRVLARGHPDYIHGRGGQPHSIPEPLILETWNWELMWFPGTWQELL